MPTQTPTAPPAETGFDPLVFWIQHRQKIVLFAGLFAVALAVFAISEYVRRSSFAASAQLYSSAKTADDFRAVIAKYPRSVAAGNAYLMLGAQLRNEGKLVESAATLRTFTEKFPEHALVSGAWTSLAATFEAQGRSDEALSTYQKVATSYANTFSAPAALMAQARLQKAKGKPEEARRAYEQVLSQFQDNILAQEAMQEMRDLKKAGPEGSGNAPGSKRPEGGAPATP